MTGNGKTALVTGASRGIGRAVAIHLSSLGFRLALNYKEDEKGARTTQNLIKDNGGCAEIYKADVSSHDDSKNMVLSVEKNLGSIDTLILNAGVTRDGLFARMQEKDWDLVMDTNLKGMYNVGKWAARSMMRQRYGRIVAISSVVGILGNPGQANYAAAKAGAIGLVKALSKELSRYNITVNGVAPGFIETDMTLDMDDKAKQKLLDAVPLKRAGTPEDVAWAVGFLVQERSSYITGQILSVDGGMS